MASYIRVICFVLALFFLAEINSAPVDDQPSNLQMNSFTVDELPQADAQSNDDTDENVRTKRHHYGKL